MSKLGLLPFVVSVLFAGTAQADLTKTTLFSVNAMYINRDYNDNGTELKSKETDMDLRVTRVEKSFSYGAIYATSSNDANQSNRTSYGLSVGYYSDKDFYVNLHYFLSSKYTLSGGTEYTKGNGYGLDMGVLSKITSSLYIGLVGTYRSYAYTELSQGGVTTSTDSKHTDLLPMFTLAVAFQ
jgi:hypothetical protein